jgi:hypothetical protein
MRLSGADPESGNCGSSHFKRSFIRDETELEINTLQKKKKKYNMLIKVYKYIYITV